MEKIYEILLAAAVCGAVAALIFAVKGRLLSPVRSSEGSVVFSVIVISGKAEGLEEAVRGIRWLGDSGRARLRLIIADGGAEPEALRRAGRLCENSGGIITPMDGLCDTIREETWRETDTQQ